MGASNAGGVGKNRNSRPVMFGRWCSSRSHLACPFTAQTTTHQWIFCITAPAAWMTTLKRTEHNLIVCIGKSEAEVTNNRRLHSRYCTVDANCRQTRNVARPLSDSTAACVPGLWPHFNLRYTSGEN